jgi:hypothetical protein
MLPSVGDSCNQYQNRTGVSKEGGSDRFYGRNSNFPSSQNILIAIFSHKLSLGFALSWFVANQS